MVLAKATSRPCSRRSSASRKSEAVCSTGERASAPRAASGLLQWPWERCLTMRLATLFDDSNQKATTVFVLPSGQTVGLHEVVHYAPAGASFENFANLAEVAGHLDVVLPAIRMWRAELPPPANGSARTPSRFCPPVPAPRSFRDFYAFEQHVKTCRAKRGLEMNPAWYDAPAFYFSNPGSLIGHEAPVYAPRGSKELDYELE